jgi:hypothetical protein
MSYAIISFGAGMAELADAADLKSADFGRVGSIPSPGTTCILEVLQLLWRPLDGQKRALFGDQLARQSYF